MQCNPLDFSGAAMAQEAHPNVEELCRVCLIHNSLGGKPEHSRQDDSKLFYIQILCTSVF